jgi:hypothetical protein
MASWAKIDENNKVVGVVKGCNIDVANNGGDSSQQAADFFTNQFPLPTGHKWVQTFYSGSARKKYAGIGMTYDFINDVFIGIKPIGYDSWSLNANFDWVAPIAEPTVYRLNDQDITFYWNESLQRWDGQLESDPAGIFSHKWDSDALSWVTL